MSKTFIRVYASFAIIVLLGTVSFFSYRLYSNSKAELIDAEKNFKFIAKFISNPPKNIKILSNAHIDAIKEMCRRSGNIENAILSTPSKKILFSWKKGTNKLAYNKEGDITLSDNSFITQTYSMRVLIFENTSTRELTFSAGLNKISDSVIFTYSRDSFLILTGLLLLTIALVIINSILNTDPKVYADIQPQKTTSKNLTQQSRGSSKNLDDVCWNDLDDLNICNENFNSTVQKNIENDLEIEPTYIPPNQNNTFESSNDIESFNSIDEQQDSNTEEYSTENISMDNNNSLYSSNTGLCSKNYLVERLESELGRAASSEQNLGLLMIKVNDMVHTDTVAKKIANYLVSEFKFKDMLFEFSTDSFSIIMHGANLEESMNTAQKFYSDIKEILEIYAYSNKLALGITTRSARLVPASRLIEEGVSAVEKAFENNDDPIVAFRPDPDLYRKFIADYT